MRPLNQARCDHRTVLLSDGRVLVLGGNRAVGVIQRPEERADRTYQDVDLRLLDSGEIYDFRSDRWAFTATMPTARASFNVTLFGTDRVLLSGGRDCMGTPVGGRQMEIYDARADRFSVAKMPRELSILLSITPQGGPELLVLGQRIRRTGHVEELVDLAWLFNPDEGSWRKVPVPADAPRASVRAEMIATDARTTRHSTTLLPDGSVLVIGGLRGFETLSTVERRRL